MIAKNHMRIVADGRNCVRYNLRNVVGRKNPTQNLRCCNNEKDRARNLHGIQNTADELFYRKLFFVTMLTTRQ